MERSRISLQSSALLALALVVAPAQARALTLVDAFDEGTAPLPANIAASGAAMALSPDAFTIYIAGGEDDSLTALARDPVTGLVRVVGVERDGEDGVNGLDNAVAVAVSPDGRFIYAGGRTDQAVSVFERGAAPDLLEFREVHRNGIAGVTGLTSLDSLSVAPGATHVYALSPNAATAAIFARDADGLDFVESFSFGTGTQPVSLIVSADGRHAYAAEQADVGFPGTFPRIRILERDVATGQLTPIGAFDDGDEGVSMDGVGELLGSPDGRFLYAVRGTQVLSFERNATTGALDYQSASSIGPFMTSVEDIAIGPDSLVASGYSFFDFVMNSDVLVRFARDPQTGALSLSGGASLPTDNAEIALAVGAEHVTALVLDDDESQLRIYSQPLLDGLENQQDGFSGVDALQGANAVAVSPDGRHVYVAAYYEAAVQAFTRDHASGALEDAGEIREGTACADCLGAPETIAVSPDGAHVYVGAFFDDAIAVFTRNAATGALTWVETETDAASGCALDGPRAIVLSPDGLELFAVSSGSASFCRFARNVGTGALTWISSLEGAEASLLNPDDLAVSRDGRSIYVADVSADAILQIDRDPVTGALEYLGAITDDAGTDALDGASGVVVSRDGRSVYATGFASDALAVFSRDPETGLLTQTDQFVNGVDDVFGLTSPFALALSPDDRSLVAVTENGAVAFRRGREDGRLGYAQWAQEFPYPPLGEITIAPDGRHTYTSSSEDNLVQVWVPEPDPAALGIASALALASLAIRRRDPVAPRRNTDPASRPRAEGLRS